MRYSPRKTNFDNKALEQKLSSSNTDKTSKTVIFNNLIKNSFIFQKFSDNPKTTLELTLPYPTNWFMKAITTSVFIVKLKTNNS